MATASKKSASAERAAPSALRRQSHMLLEMELLDKLYAAVNETILILNRQRQIVYCNARFADLLGCRDRSDFIGMRPGEALGCIHACETGGCGTSEFCSMCGAIHAIFSAQQGIADVKECRILRGPHHDAMDLLVRATPLKLGSDDFTVFAVTDISHEKRRKILERVFFHDLMNTATAISILSGNLAQAGPGGKIREMSLNICQGTQQLIEEISSQRDLVQAENNELRVRIVEVTSTAILSQVMDRYESFAKMHGCELVLHPQSQDAVFYSDPTIVSRVIGNMIKNALESCKEGQRVTISSQPSIEGISFSVHNPAYIPREVQLQIFERSFSTKGSGRGLGTYSMKLLTERYLKGKIGFTTSETDGTMFTVTVTR